MEDEAIGVSFFRCDMRGCNLRGAHLSFADLREVDARQTIFNSAKLGYSQFEPLGGAITDMRGGNPHLILSPHHHNPHLILT